MSRVDNEILHTQMNWRYACKKFDPTKKIREADLKILTESLRLAASSYGLQPWKFIVVQNPDLRKALFEVSWRQTPVLDASHFIVLAYKEKVDEAHIDKHLVQAAKVHGTDLATMAGYKNVMMGDLINGPRAQIINFWAQRQAYIAMGSFLTTAALMEIDTLPMEGLVAESYDKVLELEGTGYKTVAAIACGYRSTEDAYQNSKKVRFDEKDVIEIK